MRLKHWLGRLVCLIAFVLLEWSAVTWGQTIRFCPSSDAPIAFNPATHAYEEGASFDPLACAEESCIELLHNIFEPLLSVSAAQTLEPQLATGWERLDEVTFRFPLRQGVTFHNGEPFNAEAVRFSLLRAAQVYGKTAWFPDIARVDIVDAYTVDVVLKKPDSLFLYRLGHMGLIHPPGYFQAVGPAAFGTRPVGTGAFQFVHWNRQRREIHLEANPRYWRAGYPKVQRVIYAYRDGEQALDLLMQGELDLIRRLNPRKTTQFMQTGTGKIEKAWLPFQVVGSFNLLKPQAPLKDLRVRQAINFALHREDVLRYGLIGNGRLLGGYTVPEDPNHGGLQPYPFDLTKARQLLQEAGYAAGFTLSLLVADYTASKIENILGVSLRQLGITVESKRMTMPEFLKAVYLPKFTHASPPAFDIVLFSLPVGTIFHAGMVPMALLYSKQANYSVVRDLFLDQLYEAAVRTYDPAKASALWQKLEHYVYEQHLLLMGYQERAIFGAQQRLHFTPRVLMSFWDAYYE